MHFSLLVGALCIGQALASPQVGDCTATTTVTATVTVHQPCRRATGSAACGTGSATTLDTTTSPSASASTTTIACSNDPGYPTDTATASATKTGLDKLAKKIGKKYLGTAVDIPGTGEDTDIGYQKQLNNTQDFGQLTPANYHKYFATEPQRGVFNFTGGDRVVNIARANGQLVRCHNLIWHSQLPEWLTSQTWDNATLISILENHVTNLVQHFGSKCYAWDVVNEALNDNGTLRSSVWSDTIGPAFLPLAFRAAEKAAPKTVKLYYNDYGVENPGAKSSAAQALVKSIKSQGIRIDGMGLQSHFTIGSTPSQAAQESNLAAFAALGVDVAITELDIRAASLPASLETQAQQKKDFFTTVAACVNTTRCVGVTLWDFDDRYSWIPQTFTGQGYGTPWLETCDGKLVKKVAYDGIVEALSGAKESS